MVLDVIFVFAIIQEIDAISSFRQVGPSMAHRLEARVISACVPMSRAFDIAELNVVGGLRCPDVHGERHLQ